MEVNYKELEGLPIYENDLLIETEQRVKRWKRPGRPNSIPKKRVRVRTVYPVYKTPTAILMHPVMAKRLRAVIAAKELLDDAMDSHTAQGGK